MNHDLFFSRIGFRKIVVNNEIWYEGPYKRQYQIKENRKFVAIRMRVDMDSPIDERLRFYRIMKEDDMIPIMEYTVKKYSRWRSGWDKGNEDFFDNAHIIPQIAKYVREVIHKDIGQEEWNNLCELYDASIRAGGDSYIISETCKEVMKMAWMQPNHYILPEVRELLVRIPDSYYDFISGMEHNFESSEFLQRRVLNFAKKKKNLTTIDLIIFLSLINEDPLVEDEVLDHLCKLSRKGEIFSGKELPEQPGEVLESRDKYGWRISSVCTHEIMYRLRHAGGICLVDYQDSCIGHCILHKTEDGNAEIYSLSIANEYAYPGLRDKLLQYVEMIVRLSGFPRVLYRCTGKESKYYLAMGYELLDKDSEPEAEEQTCVVKLFGPEEKRGLIFDMDGTLWDSAVNVARSWDLAIARCGYQREPITEAEMQSVMGKTMDKIAEILFPFVEGEEREKLLEECCEEENNYLRRSGGVLYPKIRETLANLRSKYHLYIVSNCQKGYIEAFLDYYKLWHVFEDIECFGNNGQPKAYNIRLMADRNNLTRAAYVGDIQGDYDATMEAGLAFIHAAYGFGTIDHEVPAVHSTQELLAVAEEVLGA